MQMAVPVKMTWLQILIVEWSWNNTTTTTNNNDTNNGVFWEVEVGV